MKQACQLLHLELILFNDLLKKGMFKKEIGDIALCLLFLTYLQLHSSHCWHTICLKMNIRLVWCYSLCNPMETIKVRLTICGYRPPVKATRMTSQNVLEQWLNEHPLIRMLCKENDIAIFCSCPGLFIDIKGKSKRVNGRNFQTWINVGSLNTRFLGTDV